MLSSEHHQLQNLVADMKGWHCPMEFNLSPSVDDEPNYIDLCCILKGDVPFQLPKHFHGIESKKKLIIALKISAMKSGFALVHRSSTSKKQLDKTGIMSAYLTLQCQHGLVYINKDKKYDVVSKTKWSRNCDVRCKFRINISLHTNDQCWLVHNTTGPNQIFSDHHTGHFQADSRHIHSDISLLPKEELKLSKECSQLNMTNSNVSSLINIKNVLGIEIKIETDMYDEF